MLRPQFTYYVIIIGVDEGVMAMLVLFWRVAQNLSKLDYIISAHSLPILSIFPNLTKTDKETKVIAKFNQYYADTNRG